MKEKMFEVTKDMLPLTLPPVYELNFFGDIPIVSNRDSNTLTVSLDKNFIERIELLEKKVQEFENRL